MNFAKILSPCADPQLDSFDAFARGAALEECIAAVASGKLPCAKSFILHNMHCHTFFSFNCSGWSPTHVAVMAKVLGFPFVGMVDFDVLKGVDEFRTACRRLGLRHVCGMETRVFIPELAEAEINSPGEPGVAYHMGIGFRSGTVPDSAKAFADDLEKRAGARTRAIVERVNAALKDVTLDFEGDVLPVTPAGNPTERHVCFVYRTKADKIFGSHEKALEFWKTALKLDDAKSAKAAKSDVALEGFIRSVLMKRGGPGYVKPDSASFPALERMNAFSKACGAIPCVAWLNGFSKGEEDPEKLLRFHISKGCGALTIIPDRNWNIADPVKKEKSIANLDAVMAAAAKLKLPVVAGTELNTPGNKLVDDFQLEPLSRHVDQFLLGAETLCSKFE